jgi:hypothetical protein
VTAPTPNAELAYRVWDKARQHEAHFDMGDWGDSPDGRPVGLDDLTGPACGTTACLAGWTVVLAGYSVDHAARVYGADGQQVGDAVEMASEMLGINEFQAHELFYAGHAVELALAGIFGPRPDGGEGGRCVASKHLPWKGVTCNICGAPDVREAR